MAVHDVMTLARRLARRYRALLRWRSAVAWSGALAGLALLAATARHAWWPEGSWAAVFAALALLWAAGLGGLWWRARADARRLLSRADRQVAGEEQLSTAYELALAQPGHPFLPLLLKRCESLVRRVDPASLIPIELSRLGVAALVFALAAFGLYLLPAEWLQLSRAALSLVNPLVAEEGARIARYAERLQEMAAREQMPAVQQLAKQAEVVGKAMEKEPLSALDASQQLEGLIHLAEELSRKSSRAPHDGFRGEQFAGFEAERQDPESAPPASSNASGYAGAGANPTQRDEDQGGSFTGQPQTQEGETPNMTESDDPFADQKQPADITAAPERSLQMQVLERATEQFQQAARNLERALSQNDDASAGRSKDALEDMGNAAPPELSQAGQENAQPGDSQNRTADGDSAPSDSFGQGPSQADAEREGKEGAPKEHEYKDTQVFGQNANPETEEKWVRQLPTLNAREIRPDGTVHSFQQSAVNAQGGSSIPRAYRAVVRAYFVHLDRLRGASEQGRAPDQNGVPEALAAPERASQSDGGLEYTRALEEERPAERTRAVRRGFGRPGPPPPSSTR